MLYFLIYLLVNDKDMKIVGNLDPFIFTPSMKSFE